MENQNTKSDWNDIKTKIKTRFGKLSDDAIESVKGNLELLSKELQSAYGYAKEQAEKELAAFKNSLKIAVVAPIPPDSKKVA